MFNLPRPRPFRMERPPLALAMAQVRFPLVARIATLDGIAPFQERVRTLLPYLDRVEQHQVTMLVGPAGPALPPGASTAAAWRFNDDLGWSLALEPGAATLAVGSGYESVDDLARKLELVAAALVETLDVQRCDRLGVRYVDLVEVNPAGADRTWTSWFRPQLRGWIGDEIVGTETAIVAHITQSQLTSPAEGVFAGCGEPIWANIRHGLVPAGTSIPLMPLAPPQVLNQLHFLIDQDLFIESHQPFEPERLVSQYRALHGEISAFFRWSLSTDGERRFGVTEP